MYAKGITGLEYKPTNYEELGNMIGKVAMQVIRKVNADNRLSVFKKVPASNGDTIEQVVVGLAQRQVYDKTGKDALKRWTNANVSVRYFKDWDRYIYPETIDFNELKKVLNEGKGTEELSMKIISSCSDGDEQDHYEFLKTMLANAKQTGDGGSGTVQNTLVNAGTIAMKDGKIDYDNILIQLKDVISGMQFNNTKYNSAAIKRKTEKQDIVILMPYTLKNRIDVESLAGVFNLDKAEVKNKIIEIDTDEVSNNNYIYILDQNAVLDYTRLYEMATEKNSAGLFYNYILHTERLYGVSPLFDGCYLKVETSK